MAEWFPRLADMPGVEYQAPLDVDRSQLPGYDAIPTLSRYSFDGVERESMTWQYGDSTTSASPAKGYGYSGNSDDRDMPDVLLRRMAEALELPGEPSDYHFIIQNCIQELWKPARRQSDPGVLQHIERLCWLDISLIEAFPDAVAFEQDGVRRYFGIIAFGRLIHLYEREGFLHEALEVAEREAFFFPETEQLERIRLRIAELEAEDEGDGATTC